MTGPAWKLEVETHEEIIDLLVDLFGARLDLEEVARREGHHSGSAVATITVGSPFEATIIDALAGWTGAMTDDPVGVRTAVGTEPWHTGWRAVYRGAVLTDRAAVHPPWEGPTGRPVDIVLDPGLGFGSGAHPTTRAAASLLETALAEGGDVSGGDEVLDVGCGSGILAILAALMGAPRVRGFDVASPAVDLARRTSRANGVERRVELEVAGLGDPVEPAPLVVANLYTGLILPHATYLMDLADDVLILSGILDEEVDGVLGTFAPFRLLRSQRDGGWTALHLVRHR